jgi:hypothetical protein
MNNEGVFDQEVNDIPIGDPYSLVFERQDNLAAIRDSSGLQLAAKAGVIAGLQ